MNPGHPAPTLRQQLAACLLATLCAVLFLGGSLLPGRALVPYPVELYDLQRAEALARGETIALRGNVAMGDKYNQSLCWDRVLQDRLRAGDLPLWTRDIAGGSSFVPNMAQVFQPWNALLLLIPSAQWYPWFWLLHCVLLGALGYRFLRRIGCGHEPALLGMVVAVLGLWTQSKLHHNVILTAALSLFPMLSAIHALVRGDWQGRPAGARAIGALALWTGLSWLSGFAVVSLQVTYLAIAWAVFLCVGNPRGRRLRPLLQVAAGMALGAGVSLAHMLPVLHAAAVSARTAGDAAGFALRALEWDYALTLLWPDLMHWAWDHFHPMADAVRPPWLSQLVLLHGPPPAAGIPPQAAVEACGYSWVECSFAVGTGALAVALLAPGDRARRDIVLLFAVVAVFGFGLSTGSDLFLQPARVLPMLTGTDLKRNLFLCAMALSVLVALGADRLPAGRAPRGVVGVLLGVALLSGGLLVWTWTLDPAGFTDLVARLVAWDADHPQVAGRSAAEVAAWIRSVAHPDEAAVNLAALRTTLLRATLAAGGGALALGLLRGRARVLVLAALTAAELLHAGRAGVVAVDAGSITTPPAVVAPVLAATAAANAATAPRPRFQRLGDPADRRVAALYPPNLPGFHGIEDGAAYNPLPPARMEQFWLCVEPDAPGKTSMVFAGAGVGWLRREVALDHPLLDLFGVQFVLADRTVERPGLVDRTPPGAAAPFRLYERTNCLPRATFVRTVEVVPDAAQRLALLTRPDRDVARTMVLEDAAAPRPRPGDAAAEAEVRIVTHRDERVEVRVRTAADGYLRLGDPWDAGWRATLDGSPTPVYVADHHLRAVHVPAGEHTVVFTFDAPRVLWPIRLSGLALCVALFLLLRPRRAEAA